jgi:hypothetical protein
MSDGVKTALSVLALLTITSLPTPGQAQERHRIELDATVGTRFGGALDVELDSTEGMIPGRISADSSIAFGGIVGLRVQSNGFVYMSYSRQETEVHFRPQSIDLDSYQTNGSIEYFQFGGNLEVTRGALTPYFGFSLGPSRFASQEDGGDAWRFTAALDAGVKFRLLKSLHLRLLGRVPFTLTSGELYCYSGRGCALVTNGTPFVQGEVQAGLGLDF